MNSASAITPIVFCASFAPWVNATHVPDASCPRRKPRFAIPTVTRKKIQRIASRSANAAAKAMIGAKIPGKITLCTMLSHCTPSDPD